MQQIRHLTRRIVRVRRLRAVGQGHDEGLFRI
jgi:hypothetical protein